MTTKEERTERTRATHRVSPLSPKSLNLPTESVWARKRLYHPYTLSRFDLVSCYRQPDANQVTWTANCASHCPTLEAASVNRQGLCSQEAHIPQEHNSPNRQLHHVISDSVKSYGKNKRDVPGTKWVKLVYSKKTSKASELRCKWGKEATREKIWSQRVMGKGNSQNKGHKGVVV